MNANKPFTAKPGTNKDANQKQKPLTTRENSPRVKKLIGSDNIESTGRMVEFTNPMTTPATNALGKLAMFTPGTSKSMISKPKAVAKVVKKYPMILFMFLIQ